MYAEILYISSNRPCVIACRVQIMHMDVEKRKKDRPLVCLFHGFGSGNERFFEGMSLDTLFGGPPSSVFARPGAGSDHKERTDYGQGQGQSPPEQVFERRNPPVAQVKNSDHKSNGEIRCQQKTQDSSFHSIDCTGLRFKRQAVQNIYSKTLSCSSRWIYS